VLGMILLGLILLRMVLLNQDRHSVRLTWRCKSRSHNTRK
jgi:hypothetical protein